MQTQIAVMVKPRMADFFKLFKKKIKKKRKITYLGEDTVAWFDMKLGYRSLNTDLEESAVGPRRNPYPINKGLLTVPLLDPDPGLLRFHPENRC